MKILKSKEFDYNGFKLGDKVYYLSYDPFNDCNSFEEGTIISISIHDVHDFLIFRIKNSITKINYCRDISQIEKI